MNCYNCGKEIKGPYSIVGKLPAGPYMLGQKFPVAPTNWCPECLPHPQEEEK